MLAEQSAQTERGICKHIVNEAYQYSVGDSHEAVAFGSKKSRYRVETEQHLNYAVGKAGKQAPTDAVEIRNQNNWQH